MHDELQEALLYELSRSLYQHLAGELPGGRGHCREAMLVCSTIALALGLPHETCSGFRRVPHGVDVHHWVLINGRVLHSPSRGCVEWAEPAAFEATSSTSCEPAHTLPRLRRGILAA